METSVLVSTVYSSIALQNIKIIHRGYNLYYESCSRQLTPKYFVLVAYWHAELQNGHECQVSWLNLIS